MNDNRSYIYSETAVINEKAIAHRQDFKVIEKWIRRGSKVIDLGSGDGTLLKILKDKKKIDGIGIEVSPSGVKSAKKKGIRSIIGRIDEKLPFKDKEFDYAICNVTLQMVMYPEVLLSEMKRISKRQIITFPNFAFILNRLDLLINGVMPRFMIPGYRWYSTGHIHQLSIKDFKTYCRKNNFKILRTLYIGPKGYIVKLFANIFTLLGIFMTE